MRIGVIEGANLTLGAPKGWDHETDGRCDALEVRVNIRHPPSMTSAWFPTPDEIERIKRGAPVLLEIVSASHPPVALTVGDVP